MKCDGGVEMIDNILYGEYELEKKATEEALRKLKERLLEVNGALEALNLLEEKH